MFENVTVIPDRNSACSKYSRVKFETIDISFKHGNSEHIISKGFMFTAFYTRTQAHINKRRLYRLSNHFQLI